MPSPLIVETVKISKIYPHEGADRLEIVEVKGWQVVVQKGIYSPGQLVVYFPIDSVLSPELESKLFPEDCKVKLKDSRIRTIKLRGVVSQGLIASLSTCGIDEVTEGVNVADILGVSKYKVPEKETPAIFKGNVSSGREKSSYFPSYSKINHLHNFPEVFTDKVVVITEKLHGTNARYGWVPKEPKTFLDRVKLWFSSSKKKFVYGSHNVQLKPEGKNVYWKIAQQYDLEKLCRVLCEASGYKSFVIYGEIVGSGIQKNYHYGCKDGDQRFIVFDIKINGEYINFFRLVTICEMFGLPVVPRLYYGYYTRGLEKEIKMDVSRYAPSQKVMEGVVIRTAGDNRKIMKYINPEYLLKSDNTEWT